MRAHRGWHVAFTLPAMRRAVSLVEALETAKISSGIDLTGDRTTDIIPHPFHSSSHTIFDPHP
jgi:hypothetical protein